MSERCTKDHSLRFLLQSGLEVRTVLDVGVQHQTKELRENLPAAKHVLFEPVREYHPAIREHYATVDYELFELALSDKTALGQLHTHDITGAGSVSHSSVSSSTDGTGRPMQVARLDDFMSARSFAKPYLLKIDVDGAEPMILSGAVATLAHCACVIVECPISINDGLFFERATFLRSHGFVLWDIVDFCYYKNQLSQVDLVFLRADLKAAKYSPWTEGPFQVEQWDTKWQ